MDETIEVELATDIIVEDDLNVTSENNNDIDIIEEDSEFEVSIQKREYVITGDDMYIPLSYDESPQWLKDTINNITNFSLNQKLTEVENLSNSLSSLIAELEVAKNTYTQSIISSADIDSRINSAITTLNSNLSGSDSNIIGLLNTKATPDEASSLALNVLTSSINDGEISAIVSSLQNTISNSTSALSNSIDVVSAEMTGSFEGTANGIQSLSSYVGIDPNTYDPDGTGILADIEILQKQNDGIIETISGTYDVITNPQDPNLAQLVISAEPYVTWKASDVSGINTRLSHIGDVFIKYIDNPNGSKEYVASYKFIRTVVDTTSPYSTDSDGFTWALIIDQASQDAYTQALNAYDLADNKRRVFTIVPSGPYDVGDLWVRVVSGSNQIWKCQVTREQSGYYNTADWSIASTDDTATAALQTGLADGTVTVKLTNAYVGTTPFLTYLTNEIDSKVGVYSGETAPVAGQPSGVAANDIYLWFTTASKVLASGTTQVYDITRTYKYSGSTWSEITTDSNITALADLADGKRTVFSGNTVPVGAVARDIWIPSATNGSYLQGEIYQYNGTAWVVATKYSADLEAVRSNLQSQVDGKVETYYQATVPIGMTSVNNGDYWYCTADVSTYKKGKVYKYVHATTSWVETADVSRYAFDTADGKAAIFLSTSTPTTGYKINDMLIVIGSFNNGTTTFSDGVVLSSNANRVSGFTVSDWVKKINDTEDLDEFVSATYTPTVTSLQNQIDGKIESWYTVSTSDPKSTWTDATTRAKHDGDMWYQTDTKLSYYYSSSTNSWNLVDDAKAIKALADAATAQATADGKISSYYLSTLADAQNMSNGWTTVEKTNNVGDLAVVWNDSTLDNNGTWRWNGTSWVTTRDKKLIALASDVTTLNTELSNGTNTWASADSNLENSLMTEISDEGARVESKFAYNSIVGINGVYKKSGFGLTANYTSGSGTIADPYVSEFWIDASRLRFTNSNKTGSAAPFTIDYTGIQPQVTFNGKVTFGSGQTGTIDEAIAAVVETVAVGDKNINITDNLIPITSLVADTDNSGYQFIGTPTKSNAAGIDTYAEAQIVLDGSDEVYSPYVDDITISYYYRFGIKGITSGSVFKIVTINNSNAAASNTITITMDNGQGIVSTNWYIIEGIINPYGGSTAAVGSIRNSSGIKIGTVSSLVLPSGTSRLVLGWVANCTISRIKLCKVTADTVTSDLTTVNSQLGALQTDINNISWNSLQGKDLMAQQLGYNNYNELSLSATNGTTILEGGYLNTGLIQAKAITAGMVNTVGLIAENINANEIVGKTMTGSIINGATINGAVIKASYLDLDGELEVLTNYHITLAIYGANPSLYPDAVYISGTNEYRIPSLSTIRESTVSYTTADLSTYYGVMSSYNTANAGNNLKAVKIRPFFSNQTSFTLFSSICYDEWFKDSFTYGTKNHFRLSLGSIVLLECSVRLEGFSDGNGNNDVTYITFSGAFFSTITHSIMSAYDNNSTSFTDNINVGIGTLSLQTVVIGHENNAAYPNKVQLVGTLLTGTQEFPMDWTSGKLKFEQLVIPGTRYYYRVDEYTTFALNQSLYINNMI